MTLLRVRLRAGARRIVAGLVVGGAALVGAGIVPLVAAGVPPARAATLDGSLFLDGLPASVACGEPVQFTASLTNDGPGVAVGLRTLIRVALPGAGPRELRFERRELDGSWNTIGIKVGTRGDVRFVDDSTQAQWLQPGQVMAGRYRVTYLRQAPAGDAVVVAEAQHRVASDWYPLARSPQYLTRVTAAGGSVPFSQAPTLGTDAEPILIEASGSPAGRSAAGGGSASGWWSSRSGAGVMLLAMIAMLGVAVWVLRRRVTAASDGASG